MPQPHLLPSASTLRTLLLFCMQISKEQWSALAVVPASCICSRIKGTVFSNCQRHSGDETISRASFIHFTFRRR